MARNNYREYLRGATVRLKKYLYVLRPLLATLWIEQRRGLVPMAFQELVDGLITDARLREAIEQLLILKRTALESEYGKPLPALNLFIDAELTRLESVLPPLPDKPDFSVLDRGAVSARPQHRDAPGQGGSNHVRIGTGNRSRRVRANNLRDTSMGRAARALLPARAPLARNRRLMTHCTPPGRGTF